LCSQNWWRYKHKLAIECARKLEKQYFHFEGLPFEINVTQGQQENFINELLAAELNPRPLPWGTAENNLWKDVFAKVDVSKVLLREGEGAIDNLISKFHKSGRPEATCALFYSSARLMSSMIK